MDLTPVLRRLAARPPLHAKFLNTLSMLEYVGARKILKSQAAETFTLELLTHVVEESRHALTLKRLAMRVGDGSVPSYAPEHLLCGEEALRYVQALDWGAERDLREDKQGQDHSGRVFSNYLYTTVLLEERANEVYPAYEPVLAELGYGGVLSGIVREEVGHLRQVFAGLDRNDPAHEQRLQRLRTVEADAWTALLGAFERAAS